MASEGTQITSSVGRIVWGHPLKAQQKRDLTTKQIILKDGQPVIQHVFGLAIPKADFIANEWPAMQAEAMKGFPNGVPQAFSWKYDDGDGMDSAGQPFNKREGYAGHYVLTIASNTGFPPALYKYNPTTGQYDTLGEGDIKTGDYVRSALNFVVNVPTQRTHTPSLYVNPQALELIGYGAAIVSAGVNPMAAFGGQQVAMPQGASAMPVSSAPAGVGMPGAPQQMQQPGMMPGNSPAGMPGNGAPGGYPQPGAPQQMPGYPAPQPGYPQQMPAPGGYPQPGAPQQMQQPGMMPPPHPQFVQQPGAPAPQGMPQQMPAPGGMPGMPGPR